MKKGDTAMTQNSLLTMRVKRNANEDPRIITMLRNLTAQSPSPQGSTRAKTMGYIGRAVVDCPTDDCRGEAILLEAEKNPDNPSLENWTFHCLECKQTYRMSDVKILQDPVHA